VPLDKSEGCVKSKLLLAVFLSPLVWPEKEVEDQGSGNLTLNHVFGGLVVPPTIDSA
jgi:hypothetical protein